MFPSLPGLGLDAGVAGRLNLIEPEHQSISMSLAIKTLKRIARPLRC